LTQPPHPETTGVDRKIVRIDLDDPLQGRQSPEAEQERAVAIFDLIESNRFAPAVDHAGPYHLALAIAEQKLVFDIRDTGDLPIYKFILSMAPFRRIIKDYFDVCESYYAAIKTASLSQIETIDMGRRGLHNEGAQILHERMAGKVEMDFDTARRLFTLICTLHMKG
jgi:uncharacterized protein (UPF0262 family)